MNLIKILTLTFALVCTIASSQQQSFAGECGASCCIAAGIDGIGSNTGLNVSIQYDAMLMKTNKNGTSDISPSKIIADKLATVPVGSMAMYAASTKMTMQKIGINLSYRLDEQNAFVFTIPYIINDMTMKMGKKDMMGNITYSDKIMDTIRGIGDVSFLYMRDIYKDSAFATRQRLSIGIGIKAPTGNATARNNKGDLIHMMMQTGTNTWDALFTINGVMGFGDDDAGGALWLISPSLFYQANTKNDLGYRVGNRLNYDLSTRYRMTTSFNAMLDIKGVITQSSSSDGHIDVLSGKVAYQNTNENVFNNVANTGLHSIFLSPGFQWLFAESYSLSGEYRFPIYQKVTGIQQVTDNRVLFRLSRSF